MAFKRIGQESLAHVKIRLTDHLVDGREVFNQPHVCGSLENTDGTNDTYAAGCRFFPSMTLIDEQKRVQFHGQTDGRTLSGVKSMKWQ